MVFSGCISALIFLYMKQLLFIATAMSVLFWYARATKIIAIIDIFWPIGFALIVFQQLIFFPVDRVRVLVSSVVFIWSARLLLHLYARHKKRSGDDVRYKLLFDQFAGRFQWLKVYGYIFIAQAIALCSISLPLISLSLKDSDLFSWNVYCGIVVWLIGFICETSADWQLSCHMRNPQNHGTLLTTGLWKYSRHPNYFGEITIWWGIWFMCLHMPCSWITILGPLTLTLSIIFVTGLPPAEKAMSQLPGFKAYAKKTSILIPWFSK